MALRTSKREARRVSCGFKPLRGVDLSRTDRAGASSDESWASMDESGASSDESGASIDESGASSDESGASIDESGASIDESGASIDESGALSDESGASIDESDASSDAAASAPAGRRSPSSLAQGVTGAIQTMEPSMSLPTKSRPSGAKASAAGRP